MINKERERALTEIEEEKEVEHEQPVEGISSAFLQALLGKMTERLQERNRLLETSHTTNRTREITELSEDSNPEVKNFVRCFDQHEGYYYVPSRYY